MKSIILLIATIGLSAQAFAGRCGSVSSVFPTNDGLFVNFDRLGETKSAQVLIENNVSNLLIAMKAIGNKNIMICLSGNEKSVASVMASQPQK